MVGALITSGIALAGGGIVSYIGDFERGPVLFTAGALVFGIGAVAFAVWVLYTGLFVRCPTCHRLLFRWGESYPRTKGFYCETCDVVWDSGLIVGGPE
jgi:hypothetical protein